MGIIKYNKLIRDNIPAIIAANGKTCVTETLGDEEYLTMVDKKLDEEVAEYHADGSVEELADVLEVVYAAAKARGCSEEQLNALRAQKAEKNEAFEKRLLLVEVKDTEE